jgi:uncharacterized protein
VEQFRKFEALLLHETELPFKRYLYSQIDYSSRIIGIIGPRGVGKTVLLLQHLRELKRQEEPHKSLYFSYDFPNSASIKLFDLAEEFYQSGGKHLVIDEIHKFENFAQDLKSIYDLYTNLKIIFSGSCATSIYNAQTDLSRRVVMYQMQGLSYREFLSLELGNNFPAYPLNDVLNNSVKITNDLEHHFRPLEYFEEYLRFGYYPFYLADRPNYLKLLAAVVNLTIEVDLVQLGYIGAGYVSKLKKLLLVIAQSEPFELNVSKVSVALGLSRNTLYSYLNAMERGGLLYPILNAKKGVSKLAKPEKLYLDNTNLLNLMSPSFKKGTERETFFASQLKEGHLLQATKAGDFQIDGKFRIEVGGKNKGFRQIKDLKDSWLVVDTDSTQNPKKIPLWLFGFLY